MSAMAATDPTGAREQALVLARARCVVGLVLLAAPGAAGRLWLGPTTPATRVALRLTGIRDLVLGTGALTAAKERTLDAEWVGMGAVCDGVDALVTALSPGLPWRARLSAVVPGAAAVIGIGLARELAHERAAEASELEGGELGDPAPGA
jgi:hypothetical protein